MGVGRESARCLLQSEITEARDHFEKRARTEETDEGMSDATDDQPDANSQDKEQIKQGDNEREGVHDARA